MSDNPSDAKDISQDDVDNLLNGDAKEGAGDDAAMDAWAEALAEQASEETKEEASPAQAVAFDDLRPSASGSSDVNLDMVLDIPVTISMELGRTHISIRNLLQLNQGSVVELDRLAGEPMDVRVNGTLIARGEVVVVNEKFGIRLTDVISASERIKKLK